MSACYKENPWSFAAVFRLSTPQKESFRGSMGLLSGDRLAQTEKLIHTLLQPSGLSWAFSPATFPLSQDALLFFKW